MEAQKHRLNILENELVLYDPYNEFNSSSIFASFLMSAVGWAGFHTLMEKELKYLEPNF